MTGEERTRPEETPAQATSEPTRRTGTPTALAGVDALAASVLSSNTLARYDAYKEVLLAREQNEAAIIATLTLFVWDLSESR